MAVAGETRLIITLSALSPTFRGTPQEFAEHLVERLKILSPFGIETFVVGDTMPTSNEGPWLKNGMQWWVWDETESTYVPLDISASESMEIVISSTQPSDFDTPFWAKFTGSGSNTRFLNLYMSTGVSYVPMLNIVPSGDTSGRPSNPVALEKYYDTDIDALIWFERGAWRTVSGQPGDVKFVVGTNITEILTNNPGWKEIGDINSAYRGRALVVATGAFTPPAGISSRNAGDLFGAETVTLTAANIPPHSFLIPCAPDGTSGSGKNVLDIEEVATGFDEFATEISTPSYGSGTAHANVQPSLALWCLYKE